jgi:hypothetical protein
MAQSWIAVTSDSIEFENMKLTGAVGGVVRYTPHENAFVRAGDTEYPVGKGAKYIVVVVGNTVHIPLVVE